MPQPFLDWYGVWPGQAGIEGGQAWVQDPPVGVRLAVQEASKSPSSLSRSTLGKRVV